MTAIPNPTSSSRSTWTLDLAHSELGFRVRHLMTRARGAFRSYSATLELDRERPEQSKVRFEVDAASVDTANADRDTHLRSADFFDVETYPKIVFDSTSISRKSDDEFDVTGTLTIRNVARTITVPVTLLGFQTDPWGNEKLGFETTVKINRKDYGMIWNAALDQGGFILGDDVELQITLEMQKA